MQYISEADIRSMVMKILAEKKTDNAPVIQVPVEVSARHVHLTQTAADALFGKGYVLTKTKELSQPGQYLCQERIKLVSQKGQISNVAVLGPYRDKVQVELSATDARTLGVQAPVRLSGDLEGAGDVILVGTQGVYQGTGTAIVAKAHLHM